MSSRVASCKSSFSFETLPSVDFAELCKSSFCVSSSSILSRASSSSALSRFSLSPSVSFIFSTRPNRFWYCSSASSFAVLLSSRSVLSCVTSCVCDSCIPSRRFRSSSTSCLSCSLSLANASNFSVVAESVGSSMLLFSPLVVTPIACPLLSESGLREAFVS